MIGRAEQAALCIDDPRISEAHAMVSLRGQSLMLLALRGRFRVNHKVTTEVALEPGVRIELCEGVFLHCEDVFVPTMLPGLEITGLPRTLLTHTTTLFMTPTPRIQPGYDPTGDMVFWAMGEQWRASIEGADPVPVRVGDRFSLGGGTVEVVPVPIGDAARPRTRKTLRAPMRIEAAPMSVRVHVLGGDKPVRVTGIPGKIFAALARSEHAQSWRDITSYVWHNDLSLDSALRRRFDVGLLRLRERLQQLDLPPELIVMDGSGMISLQLAQEDEVLVVDE